MLSYLSKIILLIISICSILSPFHSDQALLNVIKLRLLFPSLFKRGFRVSFKNELNLIALQGLEESRIEFM